VIGRIEGEKIWFKEDTLETFQVFGVSSLGVWLCDGEGVVGRGIDKSGRWGEKVCVPDAVVPMIREDPFVTVDDLVQISWSEFSAWVCLESNFVKFHFNFGFRHEKSR